MTISFSHEIPMVFFFHEHQHGSIVFCSHGQEARSVYSAVKGNTLGHRAAMPSISPGSQFLLFSVFCFTKNANWSYRF